MPYIIAIALAIALYYFLKNKATKNDGKPSSGGKPKPKNKEGKDEASVFVDAKINEPVKQKSTPRQYTRENFQFAKMLYEGVYVQLGWFDTQKGRIYSLAFGYPDRNMDNFEYVRISNSEFFDLNMQPERQQWKDKDEAWKWKEQHFDGHQVLCNEFSNNPQTYKPSFSDDEITD